MKKLYTAALSFLFLFVCTISFSQQPLSIWSSLQAFEFGSKQDLQQLDMPTQFQAYQMTDLEGLGHILELAPLRFSDESQYSKVELALPMPNGVTERFKLLNSPAMEPELAAAYPHLKTFTGISTLNPNKTAKITMTPQGLFVMILGDIQGVIFIRPFSLPDQTYYSFYYKDLPQVEDKFDCAVKALEENTAEILEHTPPAYRSGDCQLRQYRLALACTGEYAQFYSDDDDANGDIVADVLAAMVTMMNQVNGILEQTVGLTMIIIDQNTDIIFTDPDTDPYTNFNEDELINENVSVCANVIGNSNFDIGHVFGKGGGGLAFINSPCTSNKAKGVSRVSEPIGDPSDLSLVAHEFGHQFGARHTQNNDCNRSLLTCYEPGSGSTIMGYAGYCSPSVQPFSDLYYHGKSINSMSNFVAGNGNSCATILNFSNESPTADAGSNYTIPISTPFVLTGNGTDPNGDILSYTWEQWDREVAPMPPLSDSYIGPSFRSLTPSTDPKRYFPRLEVLAGFESNIWEVLPSVKRLLNFRLTVRDNNSAYGCTDQSDMNVLVDDVAGPFMITYPNSNTSWDAGETEVITWNVANTDNWPINCENVDIFYSTDGGLTFPNVLATNVPNNGAYAITVPDEVSALVRFMIKCADNIFFAVSEENISIGIELVCEQFYSTDTPISISEAGMPTIISEIDIDLDETIADLNVINVVGTHSYVGDLRFTLIDPIQNELLLLSEECSNDDDFDISFDDTGNYVILCPMNDGQTVRPVENLSTFFDANPSGTWTLKVEDNFMLHGGELLSWGLEVCYTDDGITAQKALTDKISIMVSPNPASTYLDIAIQSDKAFGGQLQIINAMGQSLQQIDIKKQENFSHQLQIAGLSSGVYFLRVVGEGGNQIVEKIVKY